MADHMYVSTSFKSLLYYENKQQFSSIHEKFIHFNLKHLLSLQNPPLTPCHANKE